MVEEEKTSTFIKELPGNNEWHTKELHKWGNKHYVVSRIIALDHNDWETMIFHANEHGEIKHWGDLYAHRGYETIESSITAYLGYDVNHMG